MSHKKNTKSLVLEYFSRNFYAFPGSLSRQLKISRVSIHRVLKELQAQQRIHKYGSTPWVCYLYNRRWQPPPLPNQPRSNTRPNLPSIIE